jgi:hypothetical protein
MRKLWKFLSIATLALWISGCNEEKEDFFPAEFEYRLLNEQMQPTTVFKQGEPILISFLIKNKIEDHLYGIERDFISNPDFFSVKKESGELVGIFCKDRFVMIAPSTVTFDKSPKKAELLGSWGKWNEIDCIEYFDLETHHLPFSKGKYKIGFSSEFHAIKYKLPEGSIDPKFNFKKTQSFEVHFEIQ